MQHARVRKRPLSFRLCPPLHRADSIMSHGRPDRGAVCRLCRLVTTITHYITFVRLISKSPRDQFRKMNPRSNGITREAPDHVVLSAGLSGRRIEILLVAARPAREPRRTIFRRGYRRMAGLFRGTDSMRRFLRAGQSRRLRGVRLALLQPGRRTRVVPLEADLHAGLT